MCLSPDLGPTEEARLSPAPHRLVPEDLTLGSANPAMVAWAWGVGRGQANNRGWEKDGRAEQEGEKEGVDYEAWPVDREFGHHQGTCRNFRFSAPTLDLLDQNL